MATYNLKTMSNGQQRWFKTEGNKTIMVSKDDVPEEIRNETPKNTTTEPTQPGQNPQVEPDEEAIARLDQNPVPTKPAEESAPALSPEQAEKQRREKEVREQFPNHDIRFTYPDDENVVIDIQDPQTGGRVGFYSGKNSSKYVNDHIWKVRNDLNRPR